MKINKQELKKIFDTVGKVVGNGKNEVLYFVKITCFDNNEYTAEATDSYAYLKCKGKLIESENNTYYLKPFKIDKKASGYYEITFENTRTVIKDETNLFTQETPYKYPELSRVINLNDNYVAKVRLDTKMLSKLLSTGKTIKLYLTEQPNKAIKVVIDDEVEGIVCPIVWDK